MQIFHCKLTFNNEMSLQVMSLLQAILTKTLIYKEILSDQTIVRKITQKKKHTNYRHWFGILLQEKKKAAAT